MEPKTINSTIIGALVWGGALVFGTPIAFGIACFLWGVAGRAYQFAQGGF